MHTRRKRLRAPQVTCICGAYEFPHRLNSGRCNGSEWAESYRLYDGSECTYCNCSTADPPYRCEVASGTEHIRHCEGAIDHLRAQPSVRHPLTEETFYTTHTYTAEDTEDAYDDVPF